MPQSPYELDATKRTTVLQGIEEACGRRNWTLLAAHVRTNHIHVVVAANEQPELVMQAFKSYASRALNQTALDGPNRRRWARHGSTRYLWTADAVNAAVHYVLCEQGEPMAVFSRGRNTAR
jgi:REP element-mobilizing transposase RayT